MAATETAGTTILVVDDDPQHRALVKAIFSADAYRWLEAPDAKAGFECALENLPQLIVVDMRMPRMSGLEFVEAARKHPAIRHIPIVVSTALLSVEQGFDCLRMGANEYFTKPLDADKFRRRIKELLGHPAD